MTALVQIKDIVEAASMVKENYHKKMNSVLHYMQSANISEDIQERAKKWFIYNWEQSKTFGMSLCLYKKDFTTAAIFAYVVNLLPGFQMKDL